MQKNKQKKIVILVVLTLIFTLSIPIQSINAQSNISDYYTSDNITLYAQLPNVVGTGTANVEIYGQSFVGNGQYLDSIMIWTQRVGARTGYLKMSVWNDSGTYGSTSKPSGANWYVDTLQNSTNVYSLQDLPETSAQLQFNFGQTLQLTLGAKYCWGVYYINSSAASDTTNGVKIGFDNTTPSHGGNIWNRANNNQWGYDASSDFAFFVWTTSTPPATPTPSPSPTPENAYKWDQNSQQWYWWNGTHWVISNGPTPTANAQITAFTNDLISFLVAIVAIVGLGGVLGWKFGLWGFVAGANIGIFLCYLYLGLPIWAVIGILIVDGLLFFATRGKE